MLEFVRVHQCFQESGRRGNGGLTEACPGFNDTDVTGAAMNQLTGLTNLEWLHIENCRISVDEIDRIRPLFPGADIVH